MFLFDGEQSLKNFITIREALKPPYNYSPRQLRLFFVTRAWNKEVNFEKKTMEEVFAMEKTFDSFFASVASVERSEDSQAIKQVLCSRLPKKKQLLNSAVQGVDEG